MGDAVALSTAFTPSAPRSQRHPLQTGERRSQGIAYIEPRETQIIPDTLPPMPFAHVVIDLSMKRKPINGRARFRALVMYEPSSRIDKEDSVRRQLCAEFDVFAGRSAEVVF